ncbi:Glycosyl hydrolase family protein 1, partial [Clarias magur]
MCVLRKLLVFYADVLLVLMEDLSVYEDATWCCINVLTNGSANYTLNPTRCRVNIWNLH